MAKGKQKEKKCSHNNCETSYQKMDSRVATANHEENPDIAECTCLPKAQKRKWLRPFSSGIDKTACPIHTSRGSSVNKKRKPKKAEDGSSKQPSLPRRIGRWLIKKLTKGHKKDTVSEKPIEPAAATNLYEESILQMPCQSPNDDQITDYDTEPVIWRLPRKLPRTFQTTSEFQQETVMSLREMCKLALKYRIDRKIHKYRGLDEDNSFKLKEDNPYCDNCRVKSECNTQPIDGSSLVLSGNGEEKISEPKVDNPESDSYDTFFEYIREEVMPLRELSKAANIYLHNSTTFETDEIEQAETTEPEFDNPEYDIMQVVKNNDTDSDTCDWAKEEVPESLMFLREMFQAALTHLPDTNTDEINETKQEKTVAPELDTVECNKNNVKSLTELCTASISNADNGKSVEKEDKETANDAAKNCKYKPISHDTNAAVPLKEICSAASSEVNDILKQDLYRSDSNDLDIILQIPNFSVKSLTDLCLEVIGHTDDLKIITTNTGEGVSDLSELDDTNDKDTKNYDETTTNIINCQAKSLTDLCTAVVKNTDYLRLITSDTKLGRAYDKENAKQSKVLMDGTDVKDFKESNDKITSTIEIRQGYDINTTKSLVEICSTDLGYANSIKEFKATDNETIINIITNPDNDKKKIKSRTEIVKTAIRQADDVKKHEDEIEKRDMYPTCIKIEQESVTGIDKTTVKQADAIKKFERNNTEITTSTEVNTVYDKNITKAQSETCSKLIKNTDDIETKRYYTEQDLVRNKDRDSKDDAKSDTDDINPESNTLGKWQTELYTENLTNNDDTISGKQDMVESQSYDKKLKDTNASTKENIENNKAFHRNCDEPKSNTDDNTSNYISTKENMQTDHKRKDIEISPKNDENDDDTKLSAYQIEEGHIDLMEYREVDTHSKSTEMYVEDDKNNYNWSIDIDQFVLNLINSSLTEIAKEFDKEAVGTEARNNLTDNMYLTSEVEEKRNINDLFPKQTSSFSQEIKQSESDDLNYQNQNDKDVENYITNILNHLDCIEGQTPIVDSDENSAIEVKQDLKNDEIEKQTEEADKDSSYVVKNAIAEGIKINIDSETIHCRDIKAKEPFYDMVMYNDVNNDHENEKQEYAHNDRTTEVKQRHANDFEWQIQVNDKKSHKTDNTKHQNDGIEESQICFTDNADIAKEIITDKDIDTTNKTKSEHGRDMEVQQDTIALKNDKTDDIHEFHSNYVDSEVNTSGTDIDAAVRNKGSLNVEDSHYQSHDTDLDKIFENRHNESDGSERQIDCIAENKTNEGKQDLFAELELKEQVKLSSTSREVEEDPGTENDTKRKIPLNDTNTDACNERRQYHINDDNDGEGGAESMNTCNDIAIKPKQVQDNNKNKQEILSNTGMHDVYEAQQSQNTDTNPDLRSENDFELVQVNETAAVDDRGIKQDKNPANTKLDAEKAEATEDNDRDKCTETETKTDDINEATNTKGNDQQNVAAEGCSAELFLPVDTLLQFMVDAYCDKRYKSRKKQRNKVTMQYQINYIVDLNEAMSDTGVEIASEKEENPDTGIEDNIHQKRNEENPKGKEQYKVCQVHSITDADASKTGDADPCGGRNQTGEIGIGAKPKRRNIANENMIQADLKKMQIDTVQGDRPATNKTASNASVRRTERRRRRREREMGTGSQPELAQEPELPAKPQPEQNQASTPCTNPADHQETSHRIARRRRKQKHKKAKWY